MIPSISPHEVSRFFLERLYVDQGCAHSVQLDVEQWVCSRYSGPIIKDQRVWDRVPFGLVRIPM